MSDNVSGRKQKDVVRRDTTCKQGTSSSDSSVYKSSAEMSVRNKGSKEASLYSSSDEYCEYSCAPCLTAGNHTEAQGYCTNCEEYLCDSCFTYHSRSKMLKDHVLLDKGSMPRKKERLCDPCQTAGAEIQAVSYCQNCTEYLCCRCFDSHSKIKQLKNHVVVDIDNVTTDPDHSATDSMAKMNICINVSSDVKGTEEYTFIRNLNVKVDTDEKNCIITAMTLVSNTRLVLCDYNNDCLKLVDIESSTIKDVLALPAKPNKITTLSNDKVAVVLENKCQIHIISVTGGLTVERTIKTNGYCVDVKFTNGKLYVSSKEPVKFQILQLKGAIIKTIKPDSEVLKHCTLPCYIAISPDESIMYVSDWNSNKVLSMDMDGNMIAMYMGELEKPYDIIVSPCGAVYLCSRRQHFVYKMTPDLSEATVILGPGDGLSFPSAFCLNMDKHHLYISSGSNAAMSCNIIKVYEWK